MRTLASIRNPLKNYQLPRRPAVASVNFSASETVNTGADGVAAPAMTANSQAGTFQVTATTAAASGPALFNLTNLPGSANKLAFVQQPVDTVAGAIITLGGDGTHRANCASP